MINSKFIYDVLDLLLDGDDEGRQARPQLSYLNDTTYKYTGVGLLVSFTHAAGSEKYKTNKPDLILNGVKIESKQLSIGADATLFFTKGLIDYLDIWSFDGNYPSCEIENYELSQEWHNSPDRKIKRN